jgi:hypothetical protein
MQEESGVRPRNPAGTPVLPAFDAIAGLDSVTMLKRTVNALGGFVGPLLDWSGCISGAGAKCFTGIGASAFWAH